MPDDTYDVTPQPGNRHWILAAGTAIVLLVGVIVGLLLTGSNDEK